MLLLRIALPRYVLLFLVLGLLLRNPVNTLAVEMVAITTTVTALTTSPRTISIHPVFGLCV